MMCLNFLLIRWTEALILNHIGSQTLRRYHFFCFCIDSFLLRKKKNIFPFRLIRVDPINFWLKTLRLCTVILSFEKVFKRHIVMAEQHLYKFAICKLDLGAISTEWENWLNQKAQFMVTMWAYVVSC